MMTAAGQNTIGSVMRMLLAALIAVCVAGLCVASPRQVDGEALPQPGVNAADAQRPAMDEVIAGEEELPGEVPGAGVPLLSILSALAAPVSLALLYYRRWNRLDGKKLRWRHFEPIIGFVLLLAMFTAAMLGGAAAHQMFFHYDGTLEEMPADVRLKASVIGVTGSYVGYSAVLLIAWYARRDRKKSSVPRLQRHTVSVPGAFLAGLGAMLLFWPLVMTAGLLASEVQHWLWNKPSHAIAHETLQLILSTPADRWRTAILALVLIGAPFFEEIIYRGILQQTLRGMGLKPWHAIFVTSAIFAFMHGNVAESQAVVALFVFSLGLGWVYERTGRLAAPMAMHMGFNAVNALLALSV